MVFRDSASALTVSLDVTIVNVALPPLVHAMARTRKSGPMTPMSL
jgi:hypothetical protein